MLALAAAVAFLIGAIFQAINGANLSAAGAWPFWLLAGLSALAFDAALGSGITLPRRRT